MSKIKIIGSGILGLSIAEFLSRNNNCGNQIQIISNEYKNTGSNAAAANLATKGQLYGRDDHFQLKLESKRIYHKWILSLLNESKSKILINEIYRSGIGVDYFTSEENMKKQFRRVKQNSNELLKRNILINNSIKMVDENKILYEDESWVDASLLLKILKEVLISRGVDFIQKYFNLDEFESINKEFKNINLIFCTGAWTRTLLNELRITLPKKIELHERLTVGSTYIGNNILNNYDGNFTIHEVTSENLKNKVTFSGNLNRQFISSSTLRLKNIYDFNYDDLRLKNVDLLNLAKKNEFNAPFLKQEKIEDIHQIDGFRVGFGHTEILIEKLNISNDKINALVCAGAHKSGFLFAPIVGFMMQNLLLK